MKKKIALALAAMLMLAGCSAGDNTPSAPKTTAPTQPAPPKLLLAQETTVVDEETTEKTYSYDVDGTCTGWVETVNGEVTVTVAYRYDDQGREVSRTELWNDTERVTQSRYDENGLLISEVLYQDSAEYLKHSFTYDQQNNLLTHTELNIQTGNTRVTRNTYENGLLMLQVVTNGGEERQRSEFTYDDAGRVKTCRTHLMGSFTTSSYEYMGQIETCVVTDSAGEILNTKVIHRDNGGNPATEVVTNANGETLSTKTYIWQPLE